MSAAKFLGCYVISSSLSALIMTARAFLPYLRQDCKFLFIHNIFKICNLQVLLRNVGRVEEGGRKFGIFLLLLLFLVELSTSPAPSQLS